MFSVKKYTVICIKGYERRTADEKYKSSNNSIYHDGVNCSINDFFCRELRRNGESEYNSGSAGS
jgi:hypothetical protein